MFKIMEGNPVPSVTFRTRRDHEWVDLTSDEIFAGKTVVVFSLPGAFTPTCSSSHVPRYNQLQPALQAAGVDDVVCVSVNDTFVMNAWAEDQESDNVTLIPDGNGDFTNGMGLLVDKSEIGFGKRSWRYSMLVKDGVVDKMFIEPDLPGDPFEVSDADTMLKYVAPTAESPASVTVFSRKGCAFCVKAKGLLNDAGIEYDELVLNRDFNESTIRAVSGRTSVPQVFIDGKLIGGSEELEALMNPSQAA